jgi:hypothetical protein
MSSARDLGLVVKGMSAGEELVLCPFHDDSKPSAWFNPRKELFWCAVCNVGMNAHELAYRLGVEYEGDRHPFDVPEDYDLVSEEERFDLGHNIYHDYFRERKVHELTVSHYGVRWLEEPYQAAVLPITNVLGAVQGVQYRYIHPEKSGTRYKTYGEVAPVWPMPILSRLEEGQLVVVTEGAWSAMRLSSWSMKLGRPMVRAVALLGAKANRPIVDALRPFTPVYLYDGDRAGKTACRKMRILSPTSHCWTVSTSPDDMDDEQIEVLVEKIRERVA